MRLNERRTHSFISLLIKPHPYHSSLCFISTQAALAKEKKNILSKNIEVEISEIFFNIPEADWLVCNTQSNLLT